MRLMTLGLLVGGMGFASIGGAEAASWTSAKVPGEQYRAAQGCAENTEKPGDWLCVLVRCDRPGSPVSLHFSTPGPEIRGKIKLVIDDDSFAVSVPASVKSPLPLSTRAEALPGGLLEAMKAGSAIQIEGTHLQAPYNRIPLENSRKAIERVEETCAYPGSAAFWRRLRRSVGFF